MTALESPTAPATPTVSSTAAFWKAAGVTAFAALLFPRLNAVMYDHEKIWQLDAEARIMAPLVVVVALAVVGVLAYWVSAPIILGGLAVSLGYQGVRRGAGAPGRRRATTGLALGALAAVAGAALWLTNV